MAKFTVTIPIPPSLNHAYPTNPKTGRRHKSKDLTQFNNQAIPLIRRAASIAEFIAPPTASYALTLRHYFKDRQSFASSDADNRIKAAKDAVAVALGFNDNRIFDVRSIKAGVDLQEPRCDIELEILS